MASTNKTDFQQVGATGPLSMVTGQCRQVIGDAVATRQLLSSESGALCLFDLAAGVTYTLPDPVIGLHFEFRTTVSRTSNAHKIITKTPASQFLKGVVQVVIVAAATTLACQGDGTSHVAISMNGTTTGGVIGDSFKVEAINSTQWQVSGLISGSGSIATPYATS